MQQATAHMNSQELTQDLWELKPDSIPARGGGHQVLPLAVELLAADVSFLQGGGS